MGKFAGYALAAVLAGTAAGQPQMVCLHVGAFDGRGQPVGDLNKTDLQVQDAGKEQPLVFFHGPARGNGISHATIVLFDLYNIDDTNRVFAADEIVRSLQGRETGDFLYVYLLTADAKLAPVHALPDSPADLHEESTWTRKIRPLLEDALKSANRLRPTGLTYDERVRRTYDALSQVVSTVALIPGHKNLVWISRGVPISLRAASGGEQIDYRPLLRKFADACGRAKVSVDAVNPSSGGDVADLETLQQIANLTGGRMYMANGIGRAVSQAADEWRGGYSVCYLPPADNWDGKLHKLKLTSARKGVELQFAEGYYAERPDATATTRATLQSAVSSPFDSPEIGVRVTAAKGQLAIRVDYGDVLVAEKDGRYNANLVVTVVDYGAKGPKAIAPPSAMNVSMTAEQSAAAMKDGILLTVDRAVGEGVERMRAIVYDPATNLAGSATVAVR